MPEGMAGEPLSPDLSPSPQDQNASPAVLHVFGSYSVAVSSGRSGLRSPPAVPTVSPSADSSVSPDPSNDYALPARVETGYLPFVDVLDSISTPVVFDNGSTQPPIRAVVPTSGNLSGNTVCARDVLTSSDLVRPKELPSRSFSSFIPPCPLKMFGWLDGWFSRAAGVHDVS